MSRILSRKSSSGVRGKLSGGCALETRHDHVAVHTSQSDVSALRKKRGFRTELCAGQATYF